MALSSYTPPRERVLLPGGQFFEVSGLSLDHLATLLRAHFAELQVLLDIYQEAAAGPDKGDMFNRLLLILVQDSPDLAANVIALASGEGDDVVAQARLLPFATQVDAVLKIGDLTFRDMGGPKNCLVALSALAGRILPTGPVATGKTPPKAA